VTGKEVPNETARTTLFDYTNPKRAEWPEADYVVGNPPFIGNKRMREGLGDGYVEALHSAWKGLVPASSDFVMYWWREAAERVAKRRILRFGLITTNLIGMKYNRRAVEGAMKKGKVAFAFAIPDHPWVDAADGAAVRITMTVAGGAKAPGKLFQVVDEFPASEAEGSQVELEQFEGLIAPNISVGVDVTNVSSLQSNDQMSFQGMILIGDGFRLSENEVKSTGISLENFPEIVRRHMSGKDITNRDRGNSVIDCFGLDKGLLESRYPEIFQRLLTTVYPSRKQNKERSRRENWRLFGRTNETLRAAVTGLSRFIATVETSKHKPFVFLDGGVCPDHKLYVIASNDAWILGVLSAAPHQLWALRAGGTLEDRPTWTSTTTFRPFPFPAVHEGPLKQRIRELGEKLDAHRKARQAAHPDLTLTGMYNVLEKLRTGETLTDKDKKIHDEGLVTILKQIHDELDAAVLEAYGWQDLQGNVGVPPASAPSQSSGRRDAPLADRLAAKDEAAEELEQELLKRLVALNHERAEEEKRGLVRWLRPEYQAPEESGVAKAEQKQIELEAEAASEKAVAVPQKLKWPGTLSDQVAAIQRLLPATGPDPSELAACFGTRTKARIRTITEILDTLTALGKL